MSNEEKSGLKHWVPAFVLMVCVVLAFSTRSVLRFYFQIRIFKTRWELLEIKPN